MQEIKKVIKKEINQIMVRMEERGRRHG